MKKIITTGILFLLALTSMGQAFTPSPTAKRQLVVGGSGSFNPSAIYTKIQLDSNAQRVAIALKANLASPQLTGFPTAPTQSLNDSSTKIATTGYVDRKVSPIYTAGPGLKKIGNTFKLQDTLTTGGFGPALMWMPGRYAFRAGFQNNPYWNLDSIGNGSFATGLSGAKGNYSVGLGNSLALGDASTALGATISPDYAGTTIGCLNDATRGPSSSSWNANNRVFQIGIGQNSSVYVEENAMTVLFSGKTTFNKYGKGVFTGTPTKLAAFDSSGNMIETNIVVGGGGISKLGTSDSTLISINDSAYKVNSTVLKTNWQARKDSIALSASIALKKNNNDSTGITGYSTLYQLTKTKDSLLAIGYQKAAQVQAIADAKVQNSLAASTTLAPSVSAVNTALAGKLGVTDSVNGRLISNAPGFYFTGSSPVQRLNDSTATVDKLISDSLTRQALLTGFVSTPGTVSATDNVLQAIQELDGNNTLDAKLATPNVFTALNTVRGTTLSDGASFGTELLGAGGSGTNWAGTSWAIGYKHTTGSTVNLTSTLLATVGTYYQVVYTVTGRTAGGFSINFGGVFLASSVATNSTFTIGPFSVTTDALIISPTSDFDGTVVVSIRINNHSAVPSFLITNSLNNSYTEIRQTGQTNTLFGAGVGRRVSPTAPNLTGFGYHALFNNTTGSNNTALGSNAAQANSTGQNNTALGSNAAQANSTGSNNTALGSNVAQANSTGSNNTAGGYAAIGANTTGSANTAFGASAMAANTNGAFSTALGCYAMGGVASGNNNTAIGFQAARFTNDGISVNVAMSGGVHIGYNARPFVSGQTNSIAIGYNTVDFGSNTTAIGNENTLVTKIWGVTAVGYGSAVASASAITATGNIFHVTGTSTITSINTTNIQAGATITIIFDGVLTLSNSNNLRIGSNFVTTADDTISLVFDGSNFFQIGRNIN